MPTKISIIDCSTCQKPTEHIENPPNHQLHFMMTLTVGALCYLATNSVSLTLIAAALWAGIVWCLAIGFQPSPQCRTCGTKKK